MLKKVTTNFRGSSVGAALCAWLLTGCGSYMYHDAFKDYAEVYAESQNHQMLLNLARLSRHHPTYFFQSGNIQANYTFSGAFSGSLAQQGATPTPYAFLFNNLSATGTRTSQPTFNFVPLVGGDFAAHLVAPIQPDLFHVLFQAGFPVDILMRSIVQRVEFPITSNVFSPANTSGPNYSNVGIDNVPTTQNVTNYVRFLRLCDMLRDLQDRGYLLLTARGGRTAFQFSTSTNIAVFSGTLSAKDVTDGLAQGYHWTMATKQGSSDNNETNSARGSNNTVWQLSREATNSFSFQLTPEGVQYLTDRITKQSLPYLESNQVRNLLELMKPDAAEVGRVELRSFLFVLQDMATEEEAFTALMKSDGAYMTNEVPTRQLRPLLRMSWAGITNGLGPPLASVRYQDRLFEVRDPADPPRPVSGRKECNDSDIWAYNSYNRDAFSLACTLFSQISLDPAKLNYQQEYLLTR